MIEIKGNMWNELCDAICITTNGYLKPSNGASVMGRGCAKEAKEKFKGLDKKLGELIRKKGNICQVISKGSYLFDERVYITLISFPVKAVHEHCKKDKSNIVAHMKDRFHHHDLVPGWACVARLLLIDKSCEKLVKLADHHKWKKIIVPRPGCYNGELNWEDVKPIMEKHLDDRFYIITKEEEDDS